MIFVKVNGKDFETNRSQKIFLKKNFKIKNEYGIDWNGYGYSHTVREYELSKKQIKELKEKGTKTRKIKTEQEKLESWSKRLAKLAGISLSEALDIAKEKKDYHYEKITDLEEKQYINFSRKREKLINKLHRTNPLRYIKDEEHAQNILIASNRHNNTNYEHLLDKGRELREVGLIDNVQEYARNNYKTIK